jgi:hypothetical protein
MLNCNDYKLVIVTQQGGLFGKICEIIKGKKHQDNSSKASRSQIS